ncbi:DUF4288 domain-containing protein [Haliangium sp.]|uniref:DUF4288 domain-containing protein n=1 Tax=Haliangium sp. TaxID=2663208 RepID=UPI003D0AB6B9
MRESNGELYVAVVIETTKVRAADVPTSCDEEIVLIRAASAEDARAKAEKYAREKCTYKSISGDDIELTYELVAIDLALCDSFSGRGIDVVHARGITDMDAYRRAFVRGDE